MKRYNPECDEDMIPYMDEYEDGRYVRHSEAQARIKTLRDALEDLLGWQTTAPADVVAKARSALENSNEPR